MVPLSPASGVSRRPEESGNRSSFSSPSRWVWVTPDIAALDRDFAYSVPPHLVEAATVGSIVRVPLHGRRIKGWIVAYGDDHVPAFDLQPIIEVVSVGPPPNVVELSRWVAWRWAGRRRNILRSASPPRVVKGIPRQGSPRIEAVLSRLWPSPRPRPSPPRSLSLQPPSLRGEHITHTESTRSSVLDSVLHRVSDGWLAHLPSAAAIAVDAVTARRAVVRLAPGYHGFDLLLELIHYLHLTGAVRSDDARQHEGTAGCTLILVPSKESMIKLTAYLRVLGFPVAALPDQWALAAAGGNLVVGMRSAALAPCSRLDAVVVIDAESDVYKEERAPTFDARLIVAERARRDDALMVMLSSCPPQAVMALGKLITFPHVVERAGWPLIEVVDRSKDDPRLGLLSERAVHRMRHALHEQVPNRVVPVVCILNRKGKARLLVCARCNELARCEECGSALIQTSEETEVPMLTCPSCMATRPQVCASCGSSRLKIAKPGVSRVRDELEALLRVPVVQVVGESKEIPVAPVIVGTEAVLSRVPRARLIVLLDLDQEILAPRIKATQQSVAMLARAARVVGPRSNGGRLLVQTRSTTHEVVKALMHGEPWVALQTEVLPPEEAGGLLSGPLAKISGPAAEEFIKGINESSGKDGFPLVHSFPLGKEVFGVSGATIEEVCDALALVPRPPGRLRIDVEPADL